MTELRDQDEELLGRLLAELGGAEPGDGFAGRVVRGVEARRVVRGRGWVWGSGLATAGAVLAVSGAIWLGHRSAVVGRKADHSAALRDDKKNRDAAGRVVQMAAAVVHQRRMVAVHEAAEDVSRVASFPAPELPLTEQERLLQRAVHRGNPMEVAMLRPEERELQAKLERAEFDAFFPKPDPPLNDVASLGEGLGPKGLAGVDVAGTKAADGSLGQQNSLDKGNQGEKQ